MRKALVLLTLVTLLQITPAHAYTSGSAYYNPNAITHSDKVQVNSMLTQDSLLNARPVQNQPVNGYYPAPQQQYTPERPVYPQPQQQLYRIPVSVNEPYAQNGW